MTTPVLAQRVGEHWPDERLRLRIGNKGRCRRGEARGRSERLRRWEAELQTLAAAKLAGQRSDATPKVGRNDRCPCGSELKYEYCHGLTGRRYNVVPG